MRFDQLLVQSKEIVFEPGNSTRYHYLISQQNGGDFRATDLYDGKSVTFSKEIATNIAVLEHHFRYYGYSEGDAAPMAKYIAEAVEQNAYIIFRPCDGGTAIRWFFDDPEYWTENLVDIGENGGTIFKQGVIWE